MKNLLIYVGRSKEFGPGYETLTKVQIDNSLSLGWRPEDIVLATDFEWEYRGVKAHVLSDGDYSALDGNRSTKILVINQLFKEGVIEPGELYWFHDHDAFELERIKEPCLGNEVAAFTNHGYSKEWNAGSFFFKSGSEGLFLKIYEVMIKNKSSEQKALTYLWSNGLKSLLLNNTYNVGIYRHSTILKNLDWPMLVAHFHPQKTKHLKLFKKYLPERLIEIFNNYGIR